MADGTVGIKQNPSADRQIDNEAMVIGGQTVYRQRVSIGNSLVPVSYDSIVLGYTGTDLTTATYKKAGVTVATLTLAYSSGTLTSVVSS